ncbi:MAG: ferritin-like domain-containing protein [Ginsengibacter sp.]
MTNPKSTGKTNAKKNATSLSGDSSMLEEFFIDELKDIYWAEKHLVKVLPKMEKAATTQQLKDAINEHLDVTKTHVSRLEEVFGLMGKKPVAKKCEAMAGITKEGDVIVNDTEKGSVTRDVGIILAAQKVEHYEIATYGGLTQLAKTINREDVADILYKTLEEEKETDKALTAIAENNINVEAAAEVA